MPMNDLEHPLHRYCFLILFGTLTSGVSIRRELNRCFIRELVRRGDNFSFIRGAMVSFTDMVSFIDMVSFTDWKVSSSSCDR